MLQEMQFHHKFTFYVDPKNYVYYAILIFLEHRQVCTQGGVERYRPGISYKKKNCNFYKKPNFL